MRNKWFKIPLILLGNAVFAFGIAAFILPCGLLSGGTTGIALFTASLRTACCDNCVGNQPFHVAVGLVCFGEKFCIYHYS